MEKDEMDHLVRKLKVHEILTRHVGKGRAIGMGELYLQVYGKGWNNRINDTRELRRIITELRDGGTAILSIPARNGGGYYLPASDEEFEGYINRGRSRALGILARNARILRTSLPEYLGQLRLGLEDAA